MSKPTLSSTIKHLIASKGNALAPTAQESARLHRLLDSLHERSSLKSSRNALLTLATGTLITLNSPSALRSLWQWSERTPKDALVMREAGLKSISFIGIPKVINNLGVLQECFKADALDLPTKTRRDMWSESANPTFARGRQLWDAIYQPHHDKLLQKLSSYHPDLPIHILESHYSLLLSDPSPTGPLGRTLTSVLAAACLQAYTGVGSQVTSHVFGLKKAGKEVESSEELESQGLSQVEKDWLCGDEGAEWVLRAVEQLREVAVDNKPRAKL